MASPLFVIHTLSTDMGGVQNRKVGYNIHQVGRSGKKGFLS